MVVDRFVKAGIASYMSCMPRIELSPEETVALIDYARRKYDEERWPMAPELRSVREAIEKLRGKPKAPPVPAKPFEPSTVLRKKRQ